MTLFLSSSRRGHWARARARASLPTSGLAAQLAAARSEGATARGQGAHPKDLSFPFGSECMYACTCTHAEWSRHDYQMFCPLPTAHCPLPCPVTVTVTVQIRCADREGPSSSFVLRDYGDYCSDQDPLQAARLRYPHCCTALHCTAPYALGPCWLGSSSTRRLWKTKRAKGDQSFTCLSAAPAPASAPTRDGTDGQTALVLIF